jgi:hypothetical protein
MTLLLELPTFQRFEVLGHAARQLAPMQYCGAVIGPVNVVGNVVDPDSRPHVRPPDINEQVKT